MTYAIDFPRVLRFMLYLLGTAAGLYLLIQWSALPQTEANGWLGLALLGLVYVTPALIAYRRGHHQRHAILALNLLLGWTFIGWAAALIWAYTAVRKEAAA